MPAGITKEELTQQFDDQKLILARFQDLLNTTLIFKKNEVYALTFAGKILAWSFNFYQKIVGFEWKEGDTRD